MFFNGFPIRAGEDFPSCLPILNSQGGITFGYGWNTETHEEVGGGVVVEGVLVGINGGVDVRARNGVAEADEVAAEVGVLFTVGELFLHCAFDFVDVGVDAVEVAVIVQELGSGFYADSVNARNIVGGVSVKGKQVEELRRLNTPFGFNAFYAGNLPGICA